MFIVNVNAEHYRRVIIFGNRLGHTDTRVIPNKLMVYNEKLSEFFVAEHKNSLLRRVEGSRGQVVQRG